MAWFLPAAIIAVWGATYLFETFLALTSSGTRLVATVVTNGGPLTVRVGSLTYDPGTGVGKALNLSIRDENQVLMASLDSALINGIGIRQVLMGDPVRVRGRGFYAKLIRNKNGDLDFLRYLPIEETPSAPTPVAVEVEGVTVDFEDHRGGIIWSRRVKSPSVSVNGLGENWLATLSSVTVFGESGSLAVTVRSSNNGLAIESNLTSFELQTILSHFATTPEFRDQGWLRELKLGPTVVTGQLALDLPKAGEIVLNGKVNLTADQVAYGEYTFKNAHANGVVTQEGFNGDVELSEGVTSAKGTTALNWSPSFVAQANAVVSAPTETSLPHWARKLLPKGTAFKRGSYVGSIAYKNDQLWAQGEINSKLLRYESESFIDVSAAVKLTSSELLSRIKTAKWSDIPVTGAIAYNLKTGFLAGGGRFDSALAPLAKRFGLPEISGNGDFAVEIRGTSKKPTVAFQSKGQASVKPGAEFIKLGKYIASGYFAEGQVHLNRLTIDGDRGRIVAKGIWNSQTDRIDFDVLADGMPLEAISSDFKGTAAFTGHVGGTASNPVGKGRAEAFEVTAFGQTIPVFQAALTTDRTALTVQNFSAVRGAGHLTGSVAVQYKGGNLKGQLRGTNVQVSQVLGEDYAGSLDLTNGTIRGTLAEPVIAGDLSGENLVAFGVRLDKVLVSGSLEGAFARIDQVQINDEGGAVSASGSFDMRSKSGSFSGNLKGFPIDEFTSLVDGESSVTGSVDGSFALQVANGQLRTAEGKGEWIGLRANGVPVGSGGWDATFEENLWKGSTQIGEIDRFIELSDAKFNVETREIEGILATLNFRVEDLVAIGKRYVATSEKEPPLWLQNLETLQGLTSSSITVAGTLDNPTLDAQDITLSRLVLNGTPSGEVKIAARRDNKRWTVRNLSWMGGAADFSASGLINEDGDTDIDGEIRNINTQWLGNLEPRLTALQGGADVSFSATGSTKSPVIQASLSYSDGNPQRKADQRQVDVLFKVQDGAITADGSYFIDGFSGILGASIPFKYPFEILTDRDISGFVELPQRDLNDLIAAFPWLDQGRSSGTVEGRLDLGGRWNAVSATGQVTLKAPRVAVKDSQMELTTLGATLRLQDNRVALNASADGANGGSIIVRDVGASVEHIEDLFSRTIDELLQTQLSGTVSATDLRVVHKQAGQSEVNLLVTGNIDVSGPIASPLLTSKKPIEIANADVLLPSEFPESTPGGTPLINPRFDLKVNLSDSARLRTGTANFRLTGGAAVTGSLEQPDLKADFEIESGSISLPNARISLEPGGLIALTYKGTRFGDSAVRADVDLQGRTGLTAPTFGRDGVERYTVFLDIKGNLLEQNGLKLSAQSDPPGLSQDAILNLLGQGDILGGRGSGQQDVSLQQQLQNALTQIALPAFLDSYTTQFAQRIGLDYFAFEYNTLERVTVTAAKYLGSGFTLLFRRQLSDPLPGEVPRFDLRISYRPRFSRGQFRRVSLSFGMDQDRPWKLSIEYSFRF